MKTAILVTTLAFLAACAGQEARQEQIDESVQAVRDFIEVRGLEETDKIRTTSSDGWTSIENYFLIYRTRKEKFLVEFNRRCFELDDDSRIVADERADVGYIRARFETIRGCRIHKIYSLTEAEAEELENIGEAPGARN